MQLSFSDIVSRNFANALLTGTHLDEHSEQPAAELVRAVAGAVLSVHIVRPSIQLQPHSLFWCLVLFFYLGSEPC